MNEPPGARASSTFRSYISWSITEMVVKADRGRDVLFFVDNIFRLHRLVLGVSALLGRMPSAVGYQPTLASEMGAMQEKNYFH